MSYEISCRLITNHDQVHPVNHTPNNASYSARTHLAKEENTFKLPHCSSPNQVPMLIEMFSLAINTMMSAEVRALLSLDFGYPPYR